MTADWAATWSYQWFADIGVPFIGAIGAIAVGAGATFVAWSSNRIAGRIAKREHDSDALLSRVSFGTAVIRWSDRLMAEIRIHVEGSLSGDTADELKAGVDAAAAAFDTDHGYDLVAFVELLTSETPYEDKPSDFREREHLVAIRRAYVQAWIAHPVRWKELDNSARLTAEEWVRAARVRGRFEVTDQDLVHGA